MAVKGLHGVHQTVVASTSAATTAPSGATDQFATGTFSRVRAKFDYTGTVSSCEVRIWFYENGIWTRGSSTNDGTALTGNDEVRDWDAGQNSLIAFQVVSIAGGGSVTIEARII